MIKMDSEMPKNTECDKCKSKRLLEIYVQGRDTHNLEYNNQSYEGYMPEGIGLYGNYGDAIQFKLCMQCGKVQDSFPIEERKIISIFKKEDGDFPLD
jgi:hypothetical protein